MVIHLGLQIVLRISVQQITSHLVQVLDRHINSSLKELYSNYLHTLEGYAFEDPLPFSMESPITSYYQRNLYAVSSSHGVFHEPYGILYQLEILLMHGKNLESIVLQR